MTQANNIGLDVILGIAQNSYLDAIQGKSKQGDVAHAYKMLEGLNLERFPGVTPEQRALYHTWVGILRNRLEG